MIRAVLLSVLAPLMLACSPKRTEMQTEFYKDLANIPDLPAANAVAGAFSGIVNDCLVVAGGSYFSVPSRDGGVKCFSDSVFVFGKESGWRFAGLLPQGIAHGASVALDDGLLCIGGMTKDGFSDATFILSLLPDGGLTFTRMPSLPYACAWTSALCKDGSVYCVGGYDGDSMNIFLRLDSGGNEWKNQGSLPGGLPRHGATLALQSDGVSPSLFLFGGKSCDSYLTDAWKLGREGWEVLPDIPRPFFAGTAVPQGTSALLLLGGSDGHAVNEGEEYKMPSDLFYHNNVTRTWACAGNLPEGVANTNALLWDGSIVIPGGETAPEVRTGAVMNLTYAAQERGSFSIADYMTLILYLLAIVFMGWFFSKRNKSTEDFFLGGRKIPFWAAGLSMMAAQVSAIGFMSIPAKSFTTNWSYFAGSLTWVVVVPLVIFAFVPFYKRLGVTSAYEYLDKRFNKYITKFVAGLYLLSQLLGRSGVIIFLPALALSAVTGMDAILCILIMGLLATAYTAFGGMRAVIWVDVIQAIVLFGAIFLCIAYVFMRLDMGVGEVLRIAVDDGKFSFGRMDWDLTAAVFWVIIIGNIFNRIGSMATDQSVVQRYLTTRNEKDTAKALWTDAIVSIPWALCVFGLGTMLYVFYKSNPQLLSPVMANDEVVPVFIGQNLPAGVCGVVIAGIFAASMSSLDSSIHSCTTVVMRDFIHKLTGKMSEIGRVRLSMAITMGFGVLGTLTAVVMTFYNINSVWDVILEITGLFTGAMTGVFLLGIFTERTNGAGVLVGAFASALILLAVKTLTPLNFFLYSGIGIVSCMVVGYLASFFFRSSKPTEGLTVYTIGHDK